MNYFHFVFLELNIVNFFTIRVTIITITCVFRIIPYENKHSKRTLHIESLRVVKLYYIAYKLIFEAN